MSNYRVAIIIASDAGSKGERVDLCGPLIKEMVEAQGYTALSCEVLPDDAELLGCKMRAIADEQAADLLLTSGGTGFSPRDCMPEVTAALIERAAPGIPEAMRAYSLQFTKRAMLTRGLAGIRKTCLIVNLPGSPKAVRECLEYLLPELAHGLDILSGAAGNCARK